MSNIFDDARKALEEETIRQNMVAAAESATQERKEGELTSARLRLRRLYEHIPELHNRLMRSQVEPSCAEGEWRTGIRSLTAGSVHPVLVKKPWAASVGGLSQMFTFWGVAVCRLAVTAGAVLHMDGGMSPLASRV